MNTHLVYAGIGSRKTPLPVLDKFGRIGRTLAERGWILRSGGAEGADEAFESGCDAAGGQKEIYLPWPGFRSHPSGLTPNYRRAFDIAPIFHPAWSTLSPAAKKLMARNSYQVLGANLDRLALFIVCWTPSGRGKGGTGQAIRIARAYDIPVYDFGNRTQEKLFYQHLEIPQLCVL